MDQAMNDQLLKVCDLWQRRRRGNVKEDDFYLAGALGGLKVVLFRRNNPDPDGPHWTLFVTERTQRQDLPVRGRSNWQATWRASAAGARAADCCARPAGAGKPVDNLTGGSVTYSNNLEKFETVRDDGLIEGAEPTIAAPNGRIDGRFADTTLIDLAAGGTPVDLEFAYTLSAQAKLVLTTHEVYLPKPKLAVEGPGGVQASFDFRGAKNDVAGQMLTVTLTNLSSCFA
jgi:hypothetical protein